MCGADSSCFLGSIRTLGATTAHAVIENALAGLALEESIARIAADNYK